MSNRYWIIRPGETPDEAEVIADGLEATSPIQALSAIRREQPELLHADLIVVAEGNLNEYPGRP